MKETAALNFESKVALVRIARSLRCARLAMGESQSLAAQRVGVGLSTYQRMESTLDIVGVACGSLLTALSIYGLLPDLVAQASKPRNPLRQRAAKSLQPPTQWSAGTDWERVKREAAADAPIDNQSGPYDHNDPSAVSAYWKTATIS